MAGEVTVGGAYSHCMAIRYRLQLQSTGEEFKRFSEQGPPTSKVLQAQCDAKEKFVQPSKTQ